MNTAEGTGIRRLDGPAKVTGRARYAADHAPAGVLYATLVPAPVTAGTIRRIGRENAQAVPGVTHVLIAGDLPEPHPAWHELNVPPLATSHLPLQDDQILYQGQPVALVLAESIEAAEHAAGELDLDIDTAPFVNPDTADPAPPSAEGYGSFGALRVSTGDVDAALAIAAHQVTATYTQPSRHNNPIETSSIVAQWDGDRLLVYDSAQHLSSVRTVLAATFGLPDESVLVSSRFTGGGFGAKAYVWPHEILAAMASRVAGRPVKLALTRAQMYTNVGYQPLMRHDVALGADRWGTLSAIRHDARNITSITDDYVEFGSATAAALYAAPSIETSQAVSRGNVNLPTFMRSPIDGPGTWALGSAMDELARATGTDPLDLRLLNHAEVEPSTGRPWSSKKLVQAYARGASMFGWRDRPRGGTRDGHWVLGCGMADATQGQFRFPSSARVSIDAEGVVTLEAGYTDIGQGASTVFPQIAADILGVPADRVVAHSGSSDQPFAGPTYGSGTTIGMGAAVQDAAHKLVGHLAELAGWPAGEVTCSEGRLIHHGERLWIADLVRRAPGGKLTAEGSFTLPGGGGADAGAPEVATRTFGAVFLEVAVDPELGLVRLRRAVGCYSAGRIINERTARSQMIGGIVWGWGMATMEASHYEPALGRWHAQNLSGVAVPVNADIPAAIDVAFVDEFDEKAGPLGAKGIGELSATGIAAAAANAVYDAVGVRLRELPMTPARIVAALGR